jgi:hypothetical protein
LNEREANALPDKRISLPSTVSRATLTSLVQRALSSESIQVTQGNSIQLHGGVGKGTAIYRYSGLGRDHRKTVPWSLILKVIQSDQQSTETVWDYYKREAAAYQSGWLEHLPSGLVAPRMIDFTEFSDGSYWIWLEDVTNDIEDPWPLMQYYVVARHLGQFNGVYLTQEPLPNFSWLSQDWLRQYVERSAPSIDLLNKSRNHPLVRRWLPSDVYERVIHLWHDRAEFLDALDCLPQTICHFDVHRRNLFARYQADGQDQTVLIDWACVGHGPIGADLNPLVYASTVFFEIDISHVQRLEQQVFDGYMKGLRDVGWDGSPQQVRLGYTASYLRYALGTLGGVLTNILDQNQHYRVEQAFHCTIEELLDHWGSVRRHFSYMIDEARRLLDCSL